MTPKKKKEKTYRKKRLGGFYKVGQVLVILGSILAIVVAIYDMINDPSGSSGVWSSSYTFGYLEIPLLAGIIAIVIACLILWIGIDNRFAHRINMILLAVILFVLAILVGNVGALIVIIGAILYIFEYLARN
jgi:uncharacterized membrane protein (UPF0182 family)